MRKITAWNSKRAGGRITVYGTGEGGEKVRVPHVDNIEPIDGKVVATNKDGVKFHLVV